MSSVVPAMGPTSRLHGELNNNHVGTVDPDVPLKTTSTNSNFIVIENEECNYDRGDSDEQQNKEVGALDNDLVKLLANVHIGDGCDADSTVSSTIGNGKKKTPKLSSIMSSKTKSSESKKLMERTFSRTPKVDISDTETVMRGVDEGVDVCGEEPATRSPNHVDDDVILTPGVSEMSNQPLEEIITDQILERSRSFSTPDAGTLENNIIENDNDQVKIFPSLSDNVLKVLDLYHDQNPTNDDPNNSSTDQYQDASSSVSTDASQQPETEVQDVREIAEIEAVAKKVEALTFAFQTDAVTLDIRKERLERQRDQADHNLETEKNRLISAVNSLKPLCIDAETTELFLRILTQINILMAAATRACMTAEMCGAVNQEWRIAECVHLLLSHSKNLEKQRNIAKRHLERTKQMLRDSTTVTEVVKSKNIQKRMNSTVSLPSNSHQDLSFHARRASISVPQQSAVGNAEGYMRYTRRLSPSSPLDFALRRFDSVERRIVKPNRSDHINVSEGLGHISENLENEIPERDFDLNTCEMIVGYNEYPNYRIAHLMNIFLFRIHEFMRNILDQIFENGFCNCLMALGLWLYSIVTNSFVRVGRWVFACCAIAFLGNIMLRVMFPSDVQGYPISWLTWEEIMELFSPIVTISHSSEHPF